MRHLLPIIAAGNFAGGLSQRALDPVLPQISQQMLVSAQVAATLTSAAAISFALIQLPIGAIADLYGKPRLILTCLLLVALGNLVGAFATSFDVLFASRILCGVAVGGIFPVAIGLVGDIFPVSERRLAMSRVLVGSLTAQLIGASISGLLGDFLGWRGVLIVIGVFVLLCSIAVAWGFRNHLGSSRKSVDFSGLVMNYRRIIKHPNSRLVYLGVFTEGVCIFGLFPYVAALLHEQGEERLFIAGLVIGGFAIGGLLYSATISFVMTRVPDHWLMRMGGLLMSSNLMLLALAPLWPVQFLHLVMVGYGFYSMHAGLQVHTSEIAPDARASAVSLSACSFNSGIFAGPLLYGVALLYLGRGPTFLMTGCLILVVSLICAGLLKFRPPVKLGEAADGGSKA